MKKQNNNKQNLKGKVLFVGQCYYNTWFLSRALRKLGWKADVLNWDPNPNNNIYYHGEDYAFYYRGVKDMLRHLGFYGRSILEYDIFHFSNAHCMRFGEYVHQIFSRIASEYSEIWLLKKLGKKIVYSNNGCLDGVSQSSFRRWGSEPVCDICRWRNAPDVCSDGRNLKWGKIRNELADFQILSGGNRIDYNDDPCAHEVPEFYCLDHEFWTPDLTVPDDYRLPYHEDTVKIFHSVGNFSPRTSKEDNKNIKCTHIYLPVIERLKSDGYKVELLFLHDIPNKEIRYYQVQCDIVVDMLTYGWFGANIREGMMLGKPCVCYLRPEWLESVSEEKAGYVRELPVVNATPATVYSVLKDLIENPAKRTEIGRRSRQFAVKWHSAEAGARELDHIYAALLDGR